jgi:hypothetical protein
MSFIFNPTIIKNKEVELQVFPNNIVLELIPRSESSLRKRSILSFNKMFTDAISHLIPAPKAKKPKLINFPDLSNGDAQTDIFALQFSFAQDALGKAYLFANSNNAVVNDPSCNVYTYKTTASSIHSKDIYDWIIVHFNLDEKVTNYIELEKVDVPDLGSDIFEIKQVLSLDENKTQNV